ncbi:hypothetical protein [Enterococcus sp. DIV1420a]|uniref:hypothetical protein n=1 Tax=Enterococcus sp. DIV1420a TaxID=2774672 RepID=UPI003F686F29
MKYTLRQKHEQVTNEMGFALPAVNLRKYQLNRLRKQTDLARNNKKQKPKFIFLEFWFLFLV